MVVYLFILLVGVAVFYFTTERKFSNNANDFVIFFVVVLLVIFSSQQYSIGTDYFNYLHGFENGQYLRFFYKNEFLYYYFYVLIDMFSLNPQTIFFLSSFVNGVALFFIFQKLHRMGYSLWIVFFVFFTLTGFYHNQMNGLRQYTAIIFFNLLLVFFAYKNLWIKKISIIVVGFFSHATFYIALFTLPVFLLINKNKYKYKFIFIFIVSIIFYLLIVPYIELIVSLIAPDYLHYFESSYSQGVFLLSILPKIIYIPFYVYFLILYSRDTDFNNIFRKTHYGFDYFVLIWSATSMMYIAALYFGFVFRISQYFIFFNLFPVYYLILYTLKNKKYLIFYILFSSLFFAYVFKVLLFPIREYSFTSFIFM